MHFFMFYGTAFQGFNYVFLVFLDHILQFQDIYHT